MPFEPAQQTGPKDIATIVSTYLQTSTSPDGVLAQLSEPTDVAFEVDDLDYQRHTGWSVVVYGRAEALTTSVDAPQQWELDDPAPWASGDRYLYIRITPGKVSGRRLQRDHRDG